MKKAALLFCVPLILISIHPLMRHPFSSFSFPKVYNLKIKLSTQMVKRLLRSQGLPELQNHCLNRKYIYCHDKYTELVVETSLRTTHMLQLNEGALEKHTSTLRITQQLDTLCCPRNILGTSGSFCLVFPLSPFFSNI